MDIKTSLKILSLIKNITLKEAGNFVFLSKTRNIKVYKFTIISAIDAVPSTAFLLL